MLLLLPRPEPPTGRKEAASHPGATGVFPREHAQHAERCANDLSSSGATTASATAAGLWSTTVRATTVRATQPPSRNTGGTGVLRPNSATSRRAAGNLRTAARTTAGGWGLHSTARYRSIRDCPGWRALHDATTRVLLIRRTGPCCFPVADENVKPAFLMLPFVQDKTTLPPFTFFHYHFQTSVILLHFSYSPTLTT